MRVKVRFFGTLITLFGEGERWVELATGANMGDLLTSLCDKPERAAGILDNSGRTKPHVQLFLNHRPVKHHSLAQSTLHDDDVVEIVPMLYGG